MVMYFMISLLLHMEIQPYIAHVTITQDIHIALIGMV